MTRRAIAVTDDRGVYEIALGAAPTTWENMRHGLKYIFPEDVEITVESLLGWGSWRWAILVEGNAVAFVDGDEPTDAELQEGRR